MRGAASQRRWWRRATLAAGALAAAALLASPPAAQAQGLAEAPTGPEGTAPGEASSWSFLGAPDLIEPPAPRAPVPLGLLTAPEPRTGLFWTGGNPAGLAHEVADPWTAFRTARSRTSGSFHRPLDPVAETGLGLSGISWRPVDDWGAAIGRVSVGRSESDPSAFGKMLSPYGGSPFALADTGFTAMRRVETRLEGGLGVRLGRWAVGVGVGYEATDNRTSEDPLLRVGHQSATGVTLGVSRSLGPPGLRAAAYGRWRGEAETLQMISVEASGQILLLQGLTEPDVVALRRGSFFRRRDRTRWAGGLGLADQEGGFRWTVSGGPVSSEERWARADLADPSEESVWKSDGHEARAAASHRLGPSWRAVYHLGWSSASGEARTPDSEEVVFRGEEERLGAGAWIRYRAGATGWRGAASLRIDRGSWTAADRIVATSADLTVQDLTARLGAAYAGDRWAGGLEYGVTFHDARGSIPTPAAIGEGYETIVSPALGLYSTPSTTHRVGATGRWRAAGGVGVWLRLDYLRREPDTGAVRLTIAPEGTRSRFTTELGVALDLPGGE